MLLRKTVKGIALILAVVTSVTLFSACGSSESKKPIEVSVWSAVNSEKIMQDATKGNGEKKITFNTFKGDVESAQILFTPNQDVSSFDFEMGDVKNADGDILSSSLFEVYAQKYVNVSIPTSISCLAGYYPDALVPLKNYRLKREGKVSKDCNQGIWINLNVPTDAKAGEYIGNAVLTVQDQKIDIPVSVYVYGIDMPTEIHTVSSFYLDVSMIGIGEGKSVTDELKETYYKFLMKKRANVRNIPAYSGVNQRYDAKDFANDVVEYAENPMVSGYALPYVGNGQGVVDYDYCYEVINELAKKNVELLKAGKDINLFRKAHYYLGALIDEPTPTTYDKVRACDLNIQRAKLDVASTGVLDNYPTVKESLLSLAHVVTTKIIDDLYGTDTVGGVQTWCPLIDNFASDASRQLALERINSSDRTGGEGVWWYSCVNPKNPYPSYQTDENLLVSRLRGWMQYEYKIQGSLYWSVNFWQRFVNSQNVATDIWTESLSWESANGDGRLIYPGSKYGVTGPISTIRLENIREANEDYELLWLFEQTINNINKTYSKSYNSNRILSSFYDRVIENVFVKKNVTEKDFDNVRKELLTLLEKMINNPTEAFAQLDSKN